jgi:hypothetical protein
MFWATFLAWMLRNITVGIYIPLCKLIRSVSRLLTDWTTRGSNVSGAECFRTIQTSLEAHPFSCILDAEPSPWVEQPELGAYRPASNSGVRVGYSSASASLPFLCKHVWSDLYFHINTNNSVWIILITRTHFRTFQIVYTYMWLIDFFFAAACLKFDVCIFL